MHCCTSHRSEPCLSIAANQCWSLQPAVEEPKGEIFFIDKTCIVGEALVPLKPLLAAKVAGQPCLYVCHHVSMTCEGSQMAFLGKQETNGARDVVDFDPRAYSYPKVEKKVSKKEKAKQGFERRSTVVVWAS